MIADILKNLGILSLNTMQEATLNAAAKERNVLLLSPTGTGKTLAYLLPVLQKIDPKREGVQVMILTPSRELCIQTEQVIKKMKLPYKVNSCYGGHDFKTELNNLSTPPTLLVGTPGRIADHLKRDTFKVNNLQQLVLDEFDKSLEMGFELQMSFIIQRLYNVNRRYLVSATNLEEIPKFTGAVNPAVVSFLTEAPLVNLTMKAVRAAGNDKLDVLIALVKELAGSPTLIFCNHRDAVDRISELLKHQGMMHDVFHGGMEQENRVRAIIKFRNGTHSTLITTDLASRGLDIPEIKNVIHYQLPTDEAAFIHRNGRTARMNADGVAYVLLTKDEKLPAFIPSGIKFETPNTNAPTPPLPDWSTVYFGGGKKDKINKADVVGLLLKKGGLDKEEVGQIDVLDHTAFAAIKRSKLKETLRLVAGEKIKNKKVKIEEAN